VGVLNLDDLLQAILKAGQGLADAWLFKTALAFIITAASGMHGSALFWFVVLVFVDLVTRWIAISHTYLLECGQQSGLLACILNIPAAVKAGKINSDAMKHRFAGKIILYIALTIMSISVDNMLQIAGETPLLLRVVWIYLAATEALSILENFRDAGIEQAGGLLDFLRSRLSVLLDRFKSR
jgi:phage-related holin